MYIYIEFKCPYLLNSKMYFDQIKAAIEYPSKVGNVSITFPNYGIYNDNITTACSSHVNHTNGGFLVLFNTEFGNVGLLTAAPASHIIITDFQKGAPFIFHSYTLCFY